MLTQARTVSRARKVGFIMVSAASRSSLLRRFARNALFLIAVNLFMRTVGVSFSVFLSAKAGAEVMGLHSLLSGVYGLFITLGCGSIHLGTTRLTAEDIGRSGNPRGCLRRCLVYALLCSLGAGLLLYCLAAPLGRDWLGDARVVPSLRVLSLSLPALALSSCFGGYFTGVRRVGLCAAAGVAAQFVRVGVGAVLLDAWVGRGAEAACLALTWSSVISEWAGLLLTAAAFLYDCRRHPSAQANGTHGTVRALLSVTVPVTLAACLRSGLVTLEHSLIPRGLRASGASAGAALASYGILHGVVLPVVLFPSAFISSYAGLLVPEVAEARAAGDMARVRRIAERVVTAALIFSIGAAGLMTCFSAELGTVVCHSGEAGRYIRLLSPLIPIMYVDSSVDGVLKGMGEQVYSMIVNIIDAGTSVLLVWLLVPRMGLYGYVISIYVTETLNTTLSLSRMLAVTGVRPPLWRCVFGPLCGVIAASWLARGISLLLPFGFTVGALVLHLTLGGVLYVLSLPLLRVVGYRRRAPASSAPALPSG